MYSVSALVYNKYFLKVNNWNGREIMLLLVVDFLLSVTYSAFGCLKEQAMCKARNVSLNI